jgi:Thiolase, C-terminal domain
MGLGPVEATRQAMRRVGMTIFDIDLVEIKDAGDSLLPRARHRHRPAQRAWRRHRARPPSAAHEESAGFGVSRTVTRGGTVTTFEVSEGGQHDDKRETAPRP